MSMVMVVWPYVVVGGVVLAIGLGMAWRGLFGDRARGRRRCPKCWYDMAGLATLRCPECGREQASERKLTVARRRWRMIVPGVLLAATGGVCGGAPWLARAGWIASAPRPVLVLAMYITDGPDTRLRDEFESRRSGWSAAAYSGWSPPTYGGNLPTARTGTGKARWPATSASGSATILATDLTWVERWCVRKVAIGMLERLSAPGAAPASSRTSRASWGWGGYGPPEADRPTGWLTWMGLDAAPAVDDLLAMAHRNGQGNEPEAAIELLVRLRLRTREVVGQMDAIAKQPGTAGVRVAAIHAIATA